MANIQSIITNGNGNVLINTTTDNGFRLNVSGNQYVSGSVSIGTTYNGFALNVAGITYVIGASVWVQNGYGYANSGSTSTGLYPMSDHTIEFRNNNSTNVLINASGNVGIKSTPSAWASGYSVLNVGDAAAVSWTGAGANDFSFSTNAYYDTTDNRWEYRGTGDGSARYSMTALSYEHRWYNAPVGTANAAISYTQAMTLTGGGNLLIGTTTDVGAKLYADGNIRASSALISGGLLEFTGAWSASPYNGSAWVRPPAGVGVFLVNNAITRWAGFKPNDDFVVNSDNLVVNSSTGNVLIGTTTDSGYKLSVAGNAVLGYAQGRPVFYDSGGGNFQIKASAGGWATGYFFQGSSGTYRGGWGGFGSNNDLVYLWAGDAYDTPTMVVQGAQGSVGIGTTAPGAKLDVNGSIQAGSGSTFGTGSNGASIYMSSASGLGLSGNLGGYSRNLIKTDGSSVIEIGETGTSIITAINISAGDATGVIALKTGGNNTRLYVNSSGNVGIGTTAPVNKLQVTSASNDVEVLRVDNTAGNSGSVQGITHLGLNFFGAGNNSGARITAYQNGTSGYAGGMYFSTRSVNSDSAPTEAMRITHDQLIGLGPVSSFTSTHRVWIDKGSSTYAVYSQGSIQVNAGAIGVGVTPSATTGRIDAGNDIVAYSTSDERFKENITPIANALDKVKTLTGVEFDWKMETKDYHGYVGHDVGVIAQQVKAVLPEAVRTNANGYLAVRYEKIIGLLVEAMKEQQNQIDELKAKLDGLTK